MNKRKTPFIRYGSFSRPLLLVLLERQKKLNSAPQSLTLRLSARLKAFRKLFN